MAYCNPVRGSWGKVVGILASHLYYVCEEMNLATFDKRVSVAVPVKRVVYIGDMTGWSFFNSIKEAERNAIEALRKQK